MSKIMQNWMKAQAEAEKTVASGGKWAEDMQGSFTRQAARAGQAPKPVAQTKEQKAEIKLWLEQRRKNWPSKHRVE